MMKMIMKDILDIKNKYSYDEDDNEWYDWYDEDGHDFNEHFRYEE